MPIVCDGQSALGWPDVLEVGGGGGRHLKSLAILN